MKRTAIPVNHRGAQHAPVVRPLFTFGRILQPGFELSPHARAGPRAAVRDYERVCVPGELFRPACCRPPPRSSQAAHGRYLSAHVLINVPGPPHIVMLHTQAVGMKSADLAPVRCNYWQSTETDYYWICVLGSSNYIKNEALATWLIWCISQINQSAPPSFLILYWKLLGKCIFWLSPRCFDNTVLNLSTATKTLWHKVMKGMEKVA